VRGVLPLHIQTGLTRTVLIGGATSGVTARSPCAQAFSEMVAPQGLHSKLSAPVDAVTRKRIMASSPVVTSAPIDLEHAPRGRPSPAAVTPGHCDGSL
jgi:hypothetical protein